MTNQIPNDPNSSPEKPLGFDEFIAILVAFATIGVILFWSFSRKEDSKWDINGLILPSPTTSTSPVVPVVPLVPDTPLIGKTNRAVPPVAVEENVKVTPSNENRTLENGLPPTNDTIPKRLQRSQAPWFSFPKFGLNDNYRSSINAPAEKLPTIPPPIAFTDIPTDFWGHRFIDVLSSRGIIKGFPDYTFRPTQPVTRAEFAAIVEQAFKTKQNTTKIQYKDIPGSYWAIPAINEASTNGFLRGYPDSSFKPQQRISRVQVLVSLVSGLKLTVPNSSENVTTIYKDANEIPKYALDKVAAATANGLVVNYPDPKILNPNKDATRAEVAAMVHQALVRTGRLQPIQSENIVTLPQ
ncbi:MAG: S-layer homology domain-containing protein [Scytonema sp. PMC 1069.18]|nr:S-layer homology domain-containing protein [Scytonema sp. PMC 1069.18]MEC4881590.1 S-layer homology domain-containing protein [Scytonema sp. PMC 1070.18]